MASTQVETVICLSNASLNFFPENSLSRFTHRLPRPIQVPDGHQALVALRSIVLSCKQKENAPRVGYFKVHLNEIDPVPGPDVFDRRVLHKVPFHSGRLHCHSPEYPVLCPLSHVRTLDQFSFVLTDEHNQQLKLRRGPATVIQLSIVMTTAHTSFSITVSPSTSANLFSNNSLHSWNVELPETLTFNENWEVALLSAQAGKSLRLENCRMKFVLHTGRQRMFNSTDAYVAHADDEVLEVTLRHRGMSDKMLINSHLGPWLLLHGFILSLDTTTGAIVIERDPSKGDSAADDSVNASVNGLDEFRYLEVSHSVVRVLGLRQQDPRGAIIELPRFVNKRMVLRDPKDSYSEFASRIPFKEEMVEHLAVYCDLVEHSIIGNELAPIMDIIPSKKLHLFDNDKEAFYAIAHPIFRRVSPHVRKTFTVALRSLDGSVPPLLHDEHHVHNNVRHPIVLTFLFKWRE